MAKVVNQNDIKEIIKTSVEMTADIVQIISGVTTIANNVLGVVNNYKATMGYIYGNDGTGGVVGQIIETNKNLDDSLRWRIIPGREKLIEFQFNEIFTILKYMRKLGKGTWFMKDERIQRATIVINYLKDINETLESIKFDPTLSFRLELLNNSLEKLNGDIIPTVRNISLKSIFISKKGLNFVISTVFPFITDLFNLMKQYSFIQMFFMRKKFDMLGEVLSSMESVIDELLKFSVRTFLKGFVAKQQFKQIKVIFQILSEVLEFVDNMDIIDTTSRKFKLLSKYTTYIFRVVHKVVSRARGYKKLVLLDTMVKLILITPIFYFLSQIFMIVKNTKTMFLKGKFKTIKANIVNIFDVLDDLIFWMPLFKKRTLLHMIIKLILIKKVFELLAGVFLWATLAALASIPFLILAIPFAASMLAMCAVIEFLIDYAKTIKIKDILRLMLLISIIYLISMVGLAMVVLALVAKTIMQNYLWIIAFMIGLIPILALMLVLGWMVVSVALVAAPAVIGMFAMAAMIVALMLIAVQLQWLAKIELDRRAIMDSVSTIMDTAKMIITSLFASDDAQEDLDNAGKKKSWFGAFMGIFVSNKIMLQAILSAGIMVLTFISVTMILLIALELKLLQKEAMKLDRQRVLDSVDKVLGTAKFISDCIFKGKYYDENTDTINTDYDHEKKSWLGKMFSGIGTILNTICSSAIMMMSFISISMIWLMAKELKNLQTIELDRKAIAENIDKIVNTAKMVIDIVNAPSPTKEKNKDDGIIGKLLNFVLPSNMKYMIDAISTMGFTAMTMIAIGIIVKISKQLQKIQELPTLDKVQENTRLLLTTCKQVISIVEAQDFDLKALTNHIRAIRKVKNLINAIVNVSKIKINELPADTEITSLVTFANTVITETDKIKVDIIKKGRFNHVIELFKDIKNLIKVTNSVDNIKIDQGAYIDFIEAIDKIMLALNPEGVGILYAGKGLRFDKQIKIFDSLNDCIKHTHESVEPGALANIVSDRQNYLDLVKLINDVAKELHPKRVGASTSKKLNKQLMVFGSLTKFMLNNYEDIAKASTLTFEGYANSGYGKFLSILSTTITHLDKIAETGKVNKTIHYAQRLNNLLQEFTKNNNLTDINKLKETTNNYIKFLDKVDTVKVDNLRKTAEMFKQMAQFSKSINGNFDALAETINEKLMPVLEELKEVMNGASDKLEKGFNSTNETLVATSPVPVTSDDMSNIVKASNPNMTPQQASDEANRRMAAQMRSQNQTLAAKLDEVIELLSGQGKINAVMTY